MARVHLDRDEHAFRLTLGAPPLNVLDLALLGELHDALLRVDGSRHALLISAAGERAFSAGASVHDHLPERVGEMLSLFHRCFRLLRRMPLTTVALVDGPALGGGCELAIACDFVLASDRASFGTPEIALGVFPPVATLLLEAQIGSRKALELILAGEPVSADEALRLGLVNAVFPHDEFAGECDLWLQRIFRHSRSSLAAARKAFRLANADDFERRLDAVERLYLDELVESADAVEGIAAFIEKRAPAWKHR